MVKEQVLEACPRDFSIYLQEWLPRDLCEMAKLGGGKFQRPVEDNCIMVEGQRIKGKINFSEISKYMKNR